MIKDAVIVLSNELQAGHFVTNPSLIPSSLTKAQRKHIHEIRLFTKMFEENEKIEPYLCGIATGIGYIGG